MEFPTASRETQWEPYLEYGIRRNIKRNHVFYSQGEIGSGFFYVEQGMIKAITVTYDGDEKSVVYKGAGHVFGELAIVQQPHFSRMIAVEDCVVYFFDRERFNTMITDCPESLYLYLDTIARNLFHLFEQIILFSPEQKIAYALLKLHEVSSNHKVAISREDLANFTGLTRMTVYKTLKKWTDTKTIEINNRIITIKRFEDLARSAKSV